MTSPTSIPLSKLSAALQTKILADLAGLPALARVITAATPEGYLSPDGTPEDKQEYLSDKIKQLEAKIVAIDSQLYDLDKAQKESKKITSTIKHSTIADDISSKVEQIAKSVNVDPDEIQSAQREVLEANDALQSAIFGLDDLFSQAKSDLEDKKYDLEWEIDELKDQQAD